MVEVEFDSYAAKQRWLEENPPECKVPGTDSLKPRAYWEGTVYHPASYRELGYCERCPRRGTEYCLFSSKDLPVTPMKAHHHGRRPIGRDEVIRRLARVLKERGEIKSTYLHLKGSPVSYQAVWNHFGGIRAARAAVQRWLEEKENEETDD